MKYFLLAIFLLSIASVAATPLTAVSGKITDGNNAAVTGATVQVICEHNKINTTQSVSTDVLGSYYAYFLSANCGVNDKVWISADKSSSQGTGTGIVSYNDTCKINTALIDVSIPEFGIVAGSVGLIGLVSGVFIMRRRKK